MLDAFCVKDEKEKEPSLTEEPDCSRFRMYWRINIERPTSFSYVSHCVAN